MAATSVYFRGTKWLQHDVAANNQTCFWNFHRGKLLTCPYPGCGPTSASQCGLLVTLHASFGPRSNWWVRPELVFPNPSKNLVNTYVNSVVSVCVEVDCRKQQTYSLRLYFVHFSIANLLMILVVSISHRSSCSVFFRIRLFSLFLLMVLLSSFYNLKFRKWPFLSTAFGYYERQICVQIISQVGKRRLQAHYPKTS